jgi:hypothetical protein
VGEHFLMSLTLASFVAGIVTACVVAKLMLRRWQQRQTIKASNHAVARARRAHDGENDGEVQLENAGYAILQRQAHAIWAPRVDGVADPYELRADFLVQDIESEEILVAEVKTGELAPELSTATTRRQLLEYQLAFGVNAVLLVWPERNIIQRVEFVVHLAANPVVPLRRRSRSLWRVAAYSLASLGIAGLLLLV